MSNIFLVIGRKNGYVGEHRVFVRADDEEAARNFARNNMPEFDEVRVFPTTEEVWEREMQAHETQAPNFSTGEKEKQDKLLRTWQKRLRLEDWTFKLIDACSPEDFQIGGVCGECDYQEVNKSAVIRIISPSFYGECLIPFNYEKTLVHELLHAKFALLENSENELQNRVVHQLIEDLARALVEASGEREEAEK